MITFILLSTLFANERTAILIQLRLIVFHSFNHQTLTMYLAHNKYFMEENTDNDL